MSSNVYEWIRIASSLSPLVPITCLFLYQKKQPRQNKILVISLIISFVFDLVGWALMEWHDPRSTSLSNNLYFIIAFPAIMWFYHDTLVKKSLKVLVRLVTIGFLVVALILSFRQGLNELNFNILTLSSILISITSFFFVADLNLMDPGSFARNPFHETNILLNTSLALYHFVTIIIFSVSDYVFAHVGLEDAYYFWAFHNAVNISKNIGITVAFYLSARRFTSFTKSSILASRN